MAAAEAAINALLDHYWRNVKETGTLPGNGTSADNENGNNYNHDDGAADVFVDEVFPRYGHNIFAKNGADALDADRRARRPVSEPKHPLLPEQVHVRAAVAEPLDPSLAVPSLGGVDLDFEECFCSVGECG